MADYTELVASLPLDDIARELGTDRETARAAAETAIPALLGGMKANAADPSGAASLVGALSQHDPRLVEGGVDLRDVNVDDGEKVVRNVFGPASGDVATRLGASQGLGAGIFQKLLPILAPIVLSYLTNKVLGKAGQAQAAPQSSGGGGLGDLLGSILGGGSAQQEAPAPSTRTGRTGPAAPAAPAAPGGVDINDILNDMLGSGAAPSRSGSATPSSPAGGGVEDLLGSVLGGLLGGGKR